MLPEGMSADLAPAPVRDRLLEAHLPARTVVVLQRGPCACDLVGLPGTAKADQERGLRKRYREMGASRAQVIEALELHRRPRPRIPYQVSWPESLAGFVAEHARNAGPALYQLSFGAVHPAGGKLPDGGGTATLTAAKVRSGPRGWLDDSRLVLVKP